MASSASSDAVRERASQIPLAAQSVNPAASRYRVLSRYRLLARLGSGGMAEVYLAVPNGFNKLQVLKLIRPDLSDEERQDFAQMFRDEARLAARLNHTNIVQSHEVGSEDGNDFIAMEYLDGQPFSRILERGWVSEPRFSLEMQLFVLCQVLEGLEYAHTLADYDGTPLHIVHRDVSPQNIFVTYTGHTKLVDFGIAKTLESCKTRAGVVKGKVPYMSPEQVLNRSVDFRADLFSVGVILWETIACRAMHGTESVYEILRRLVHGELPNIRDVVPDVPDALERILLRALARKPEDRFANAGAFRDALAAFLDQRSKVSARELGDRLSRMFSAERVEFNAVVRRAMSDLAAAPEGTPPTVHLVPTLRVLAASSHDEESGVGAQLPPAALDRLQQRPSLDTFRSAESSPAPSNGPRTTPVRAQSVLSYDKNPTPPPVNTTQAPRKPTPARRWIAWAAAGAIAVAGAFVWTLRNAPQTRDPSVNALLSGSDPHHPPVPAAAHEEAAKAPAVPQPLALADPPKAAAAEAPAPALAPAQLTIHPSPESAEVYLDGTRLSGSPARAERPRDDEKHVLEVKAPGYRARKIDLTFDRDWDLEVSLLEAEGGVATTLKPARPLPVAAPRVGRTSTGRTNPSPASEDAYDAFPAAPAQKPSPPPLDTRGAF